MKVIFLDIDGVLATEKHIRTLSENGEDVHEGVDAWRSDRTEIRPYAKFDPEAVANLNRIIRETGAKIVVSSTWRHRGVVEMRKILKAQGVQGDVIDCTPLRNWMGNRRLLPKLRGRGLQIAAWLDRHPHVERYVILDDDSDMLYLMDDLVCCDPKWGIVEEVAGMAIQYLNKE